MHWNFQQVFVLLLALPRFLNLIEHYHFYLYKIVWLQILFFIICFDAARKRFVESKLQFLDPHSFSVDLYLKALEGAKEKKDVQKRLQLWP